MIGYVYLGLASVSKFNTPLNLVAFVVFLVAYIKSFTILNKHRGTSRNISSTNNDIMKITKFYFTLYLISHGPLFAISVFNLIDKFRIMEKFQKENQLIFLEVTSLSSNLVGIINALIVLKMNRGIKVKILNWFSRIQNQVSNINSNDNDNNIKRTLTTGTRIITVSSIKQVQSD